MEEQQEIPLANALLSIKKYQNKIFVIKYGGSIMENPNTRRTFVEDIVLLQKAGINIVIVHGGGPEISNVLKRLNIESKFIQGMRVTSKEVMEVAEMVLSGTVNKRITMSLCKNGINAVGISGKDANLICARKKYIFNGEEKIDIGYVGEITSINRKFLLDLIDKKYVPVISPIGCDEYGNTYNINADYAASFISSTLGAEKLIQLTDVEGVYRDINDKTSLISSITKEEAKSLINSGIIKGGMIPKIECCIETLEKGTKSVHLSDGRREHSLIFDIISERGTRIIHGGGLSACQNTI